MPTKLDRLLGIFLILVLGCGLVLVVQSAFSSAGKTAETRTFASPLELQLAETSDQLKYLLLIDRDSPPAEGVAKSVEQSVETALLLDDVFLLLYPIALALVILKACDGRHGTVIGLLALVFCAGTMYFDARENLALSAILKGLPHISSGSVHSLTQFSREKWLALGIALGTLSLSIARKSDPSPWECAAFCAGGLGFLVGLAGMFGGVMPTSPAIYRIESLALLVVFLAAGYDLIDIQAALIDVNAHLPTHDEFPNSADASKPDSSSSPAAPPSE